MDDGNFKYFAFISYSRSTDSRVAAFLQRRLERFRIPIRKNEVSGAAFRRRYFKPVFRDRRDLPNSQNSFTEDIRKALMDSRYLIVLCSPSAAKSIWVDKEVRFFLNNNCGDWTRVVPIVVGGEPNKGGETECLPECLRTEAITRRNLPSMIPDEGAQDKDGWEDGLVQALSYILCVSKENIKASINAERIRQMRIYLCIGMVCSVAFAVLALWALNAERRAEASKHIAEARELEAVRGRHEIERLQSRQDLILQKWEALNPVYRDRDDILRERIRASTNHLDKLCGQLGIIAGPKVTKMMLLSMMADFMKKHEEGLAPDAKIRLTSWRDLKRERLANRKEARKYADMEKVTVEKMSRFILGNVTNREVVVEGVRFDDLQKAYEQVMLKKREIHLNEKSISCQMEKLAVQLFADHDRKICGGAISNVIACVETRPDDDSVLDLCDKIDDVSPFKSEVLWLIISRMKGLKYNTRRFYSELAMNQVDLMHEKNIGRHGLNLVAWNLRMYDLALTNGNQYDALQYLARAVDMVCADLGVGDRSFQDLYGTVDAGLLDNFCTLQKRDNKPIFAALWSLLKTRRAIVVLPRCDDLYRNCILPRFKGWNLEWDEFFAFDSVEVGGELLSQYLELEREEVIKSLELHFAFVSYLGEHGDFRGADAIEKKLLTVIAAFEKCNVRMPDALRNKAIAHSKEERADGGR